MRCKYPSKSDSVSPLIKSYPVRLAFSILVFLKANVLLENESSNNNALGIICSISIFFENKSIGLISLPVKISL